MQRQKLRGKLSQVTGLNIASVGMGQSHKEIIMLLVKIVTFSFVL